MRSGNRYSNSINAKTTVKRRSLIRTLFVACSVLLGAQSVAQTSTFNFSGSIASYTVGAGVTSLQITAKGAQGGQGGFPGGQGAIMVGNFTVVPGHVLNILVAGQGVNTGSGLAAGGGGGSFVWDVTAGNNLLIAAGGGGGGGSCAAGTGTNASSTTTPTSGGFNGSGAGGSGGNGGSGGGGPIACNNASGGGGCGWSSNGGNGTVAPAAFGGLSPLNGGTGGAAGDGQGTAGGFGGGGGSAGNCGASGGGGGYNGGGGANTVNPGCSLWGIGGGGGSFNGGTSQSNSVGNSGNGQVTITVLVVNTPPTFTGGSPQGLSVCQNSTSNSINGLLSINDPDVGQTETWTVTSGPANGVVTTGGTQLSTGGVVTPTGFSYTPTYGFTGTDAFTIQVSDGSATATTVILVTVNPLPAAITGTQSVCPGSTTTLSDASPGGVWTSSTPAVATVGTSGVVSGLTSGTTTISYTILGCSATATVTVLATPSVTSLSSYAAAPGASITINGSNFNSTPANDIVYFGATRATVTAASTSALTVTVPNGSTYMPIVSVENNACAFTGYAPYPFLATYNNAGFVASTMNFATPVTTATGVFPNHLSYGDIDGDGKTDIISNNFTAGTVTVYRNTSTTGSVSFAAPVTVATVSSPQQPGVGDIDGDGKLDIAVMVSGTSTINTYLNTSTPGTVSFTAATSTPFVGSGRGCYVRDIDKDGKADVVAVAGTTMTVLRSTSSVGSISFAPRVDFAAGASVTSNVYANDVDGDGKADIIVGRNNSTTSLSIWRNISTPGTIALAARQDFTTVNSLVFSVGMADIDGDGVQDIVTVNQSLNSFSVFQNTSAIGTISLGTRSDFATSVNENDFSIGDFNGDGKPDIALTSTSSGVVNVYRNTSSGPGTFTFGPMTNFGAGSQPAGVVATDIDGDGKVDVVITNQGSNNFAVYLNNPLQPITGTTTVCPGATTTLSDATAGGTWSSSNPAIATVGAGTGVVTGQAAGTATITYAGTAGSGFTDNIVTTTVTVSPAPAITSLSTYVAAPGTSITINGSNFNATPSSDIVYFGATRAVVTAASTTQLTVTVPNDATYAPVSVNNQACPLTGYSNYQFLPTYNNAGFVANTVNFDSKVDISTPGVFPNHIASADLDNDGKTDIITVNFTSQNISIFPNTSVSGTVSFGAPITISFSGNIGFVATGDMDGDGKPEIVVPISGSNLSMLRNTSVPGTISFAAAVTVGSVPSFNSAFLADIDGDGRADVVTANQGGNSVSVYRSTSSVGTLSLAARQDFAAPAGANVTYAMAGDIDGDGKPDIVCANAATNNVSVFPNTSTPGTVSFGVRVDFAAGATPQQVALADIDGDGKLDIMDVNQSTPSLSIFPNTSTPGSITAGARLDFPAGGTVHSVAAGDFNGDGKPDVVTGSISAGNVWVYQNTSSGPGSFTLATSVNFGTGAGPGGTVVGDIDGDGKADIVTDNQNVNTISILRNKPLQPITGTAVVCPGATTTLSDATTGGTWSSSNPAMATVGSSSGVVTGVGVAGGTVTITYAGTAGPTFTGNITTIIVTVNPSPAAIGGPTSVCTGATITLTDATPGGTWSSSNPALATVGSASGVVTGFAPGTPTIFYTLTSTGCATGLTVTVNQSPTAISGTFALCVGGSTTLTDGYAGGTWTSSAPAVATVGSSSGTVNGLTPGTSNITYTMPGSCAISQQVTVNPNPSAIGGSNTVCVGSMTTLTDATSGGSWTSSNVPVATIGAGTGTVTGISVGTTTISYTLGTGCFATKAMTVNPLPSAIGVPVTTSFSFSGAIQNFTVPVGVTTITVLTKGAQGGGNGGNGAIMQGDITVTPGQVLKVLVGQQGAIGNESCCGARRWGGGGGSFVTTSSNTPLVVAGGGGGAGVFGGIGQDASTGTSGGSISGALGGSSGNGGAAGTESGGGCGAVGSGGGGLLTNGGGTYGGVAFVNGGNAIDGPGCLTITSMGQGGFGGGGAGGNGGGGGGGYSGGSGGANDGIYPGGGGGGSFNSGANQANSVGNTGNGSVVISYIPPSTVCVGSSITMTDATAGGTWTSSTPAVATIGSSSGIVNGLTAGTTTITYTLPTGCFVTTVVTVNPLPAAITGASAVCVGLTTVLNDVTGTGTWSSSNTGVATIGSLSGVVTGVTAGTVTITYNLTTGCIATKAMTVNPLPAAITGTLTACPGTTTTLSDASGGGTWTSNNTGVATIGSSSGVVTGVSAGTSTITYTLPTGCINTATVTINSNPAAVTGLSTVCVGATTTLSDGTGGGTWSTSNGAIALVGSSTGVVTGVTPNPVTITYTLPTGCLANFPMTVNPNPAAIAGTTNVCVGLTTTLTDASGTSTWTSSNTAVATVGASTGVVTGVSAGTVTITFTLPTGCFITTPFTVNPTPAAISGTNNVCLGLTRTLTDATSGGTWTSSVPANASVGSSTGIVTGLTAGTTNIIYTLPAGCTATMPFTVNPLPAAITGASSVCTGATTTLTDASGTSTWSSSNTAVATIGASTGVVTGVSAGTVNITFTLGTGCIATTPFTVNQTPAAIVGSNAVCVGSSTTLTDALAGGTWTSTVPANASVGSSSGIVNGLINGTTSIVYTLPGGCTASFPMTVNITPAAITGSTTVCTGATTTLTESTGGGSWSSSNTAIATVGTGSGVVSGVAAGTVTISYIMTGTGCFATYSMTVNQTPPAISGVSNVCIGIPVTFSDGIGGGTWTSSAPGTASVGSSSGVVLGAAAGTANIIYTLPGGCTATMPITVNLQPAAIGGTPNVCVGLTNTLTDGSPSGTWTSSNVALATIGSSSGTVLGVSAGTLNITYTLNGGCFSVMPFTVNPTPAAITGTAVVCVNSTTTLADATFGGTWSSSNGALATVGTSSGIVTGVAAGNPNIIYTLPGGCTAVKTITVNAIPALNTVTGGGAYCSGGTGVTISLSGSEIGVNYQLFVGPTPSGSVVSGTGGGITFGLRTAAGTYTVVATNATTGCTRTMTGSVTVVINPLPTIYNVTGGGAICSGGTGLHIGLNLSAAAGVTYQLFNGPAVTGAIPGTGVPLDFGVFTAAGTYTAVATITATGCTSNMNGSAVITVNPLPTVRTVTGGGSYCTGGVGVHIGLNPSDVGINYQLFNGLTAVGSPVPGTGAAIDFGFITGAGTYTVQATNVVTGCISTMSGTATVVVNVLPTAFTVTGGGSYCTGGAGVPIFLSGSTIGVNYQLMRGVTPVGAAIAGTNLALTFPNQTIAGTYTVVANNPSTTCSNNMLSSVTVSVNPLPVAYNVTGGGAYCSGGTGVHIGLNGSDPGISYQAMIGLAPSGLAVTGTGLPIDLGLFPTAATYTVMATNVGTSCTNTMTGTATVTINLLPTTFSMTGGGTLCVGGTGFPIGLNGSTPGVNYQLYNGASPVGAVFPGTGIALAFGTFTAPGTYTVIATNPATGCVATMLGTSVITVNPLPTVFTVTGGGSYCSGGTGVNISLSGSQIGVNYQLFRGALGLGTVGGTGGVINFGLQTTAGSYTVVATNPSTSCTINMTGSAIVAINPLPNAYSVTGGGGYCTGGPGAHVGLASSDIGVNYQLMRGLVPVGTALPGTGAALDFGFQTVAGPYTVVATNTTTSCTANMTGSVTVSINGLPSVFNVSGTGSYCAGGTGVAVLLSGSTSGVNYQLYNGITAVGAPVPGSGIGLNFGLQTAAGTYTVVATDGTTGCTNNMSGAAVITINPLPAAFTVTGGGGFCLGGTGVPVGLSNSVVGVNYQLFRGVTGLGIVAGTGGPITFGLQTTAGAYTVQATNVATGCPNTMIGTVNVSINLPPTAFTVSGTGHYCVGGTGVHVFLGGSAVGVNYQLFNGVTAIGAPMVGTSFSLDFGAQTAAGTYTVVATDAVTGCTNTMTSSAVITIDPLPTAFAVLGGGSFCPGGSGVDVSLGNSFVGVNYQLYNGVTPVGAPIGGLGTPLDFGLQTGLGTYTVVATVTSTGCMNNMSGSATVSNYPLPAIHTVTGGGSYCAGGTGVPVALNGSDVGINYQLYNGPLSVGGPVAGTGIPISFGLQTAAGGYTVIATNATTTCADTMYDSAVVVINPLPGPHTITGGGSYCPGGTGVNISIDGSDPGINYQLYRGITPVGAPMAGTGFAMSFGSFTVAGVYTISAKNVSTLCSSNMLGSVTVSINTLPTVYGMTGGGSYCSGGTGVHVGLSGSQTGVLYQLYNGPTPVGSADTGTGSSLDFGLQTTAGVYTVKATNFTTGCVNNMSGSSTVNVNPLPTAYIVTGGGGYCSGGTGVHIGLSGSNVGITYRLYNGITLVGSPMGGTGTSLDFGIYTDTGTYTIVATNPVTGCINTMSGSAVITINALPVVYTVSGSSAGYCAGGTGVVVYLSNSQLGVSYQLYRGALPIGTAMAGTGTPLDFGPQTVAGTYTVVAVNTTTACSRTMSGAATITVYSLPIVNTVTGGGSYCPGGAGVHIGLTGSSTGVRYQLNNGSSPSGGPVNGTGLALDFGLKTATGNYTVVATNAVTGCTSDMSGSATVSINPLPVVFTVTGGGSFCTGGTGVTVGLSGSVTGTNYQLYHSSLPVGGVVAGTGTPISFGLQTATGNYTVVAIDAVTGCTNNMTGSATISLNPLPTVFAVTGGGNYCPGGTGVTVGLSGSNTGISYQLFMGTTPVGGAVPGTGSAINFGLESALGTYTVVATNTTTSCTRNMSGSAVVGLNPVPYAYTVMGGGSYCEGGSGVHVGLSGSTTGITYQLYNGGPYGSPVAGTGTLIDFGVFIDTGTYTVIARNNTTSCTNTMAGSVSISINPVVTPGVSIITGVGDSVCSGTSVTFTALALNGGSSPSYQWSVNGVNTGTGNTYVYTPANGDIVSVVMESSAPCVTTPIANNAVTMTVINKVMPMVVVEANPGNTVCRNTLVTFTATPTAGGTSPSYQWVKNGVNVGTSLPTYSYTPNDSDVVYCMMTSSYYCPIAATVTSNHIMMEVDTPVVPVVTVTANPGLYLAQGQSVTLTATVVNNITNPTYQWLVNGIPVPGAVLPTLTSNEFTDLAVVRCDVLSGGGCSGVLGTNSVTLHVKNVGVVQVSTNGGDIKLVPNPNKGTFTVKGTLGVTSDEDVTIEVTNMLGQVIYKDKVIARGGEINEKIQLSNSIANGMYILTLHSDTENKVFHVVIEQ